MWFDASEKSAIVTSGRTRIMAIIFPFRVMIYDPFLEIHEPLFELLLDGLNEYGWSMSDVQPEDMQALTACIEMDALDLLIFRWENRADTLNEACQLRQNFPHLAVTALLEEGTCVNGEANRIGFHTASIRSSSRWRAEDWVGAVKAARRFVK